MTKRNITINGVDYPIVFSMDTLINFESIVNKSFFDTDFKTLKDRMALIYAAVITADEDSSLTVEALKGKNDLDAVNEIIAAYNIVAEAMGVFFKVPEMLKRAEDSENTDNADGAESPKN